jgi:hypothetical protein
VSATLRFASMGGRLGTAGWLGVAVLAGALLFLALVLEPLEVRNELLARQLNRAPQAHATTSGQQLAAFYEYLESDQAPQAWLARLDGIARAAGVELRSADYRMRDPGARIARYEIALPVTGSYAQIRRFLENALYEIPVLSLDQVSFSRLRVDDPRIQAEVRVTFHLVRQ